MIYAGHPYFVAVQYHPEYISRPMKASPPYLGLLLAACGKLPLYIGRGCRMSPHTHNISDSDFEEDEELSDDVNATPGNSATTTTTTKVES